MQINDATCCGEFKGATSISCPGLGQGRNCRHSDGNKRSKQGGGGNFPSGEDLDVCIDIFSSAVLVNYHSGGDIQSAIINTE